MSPRLALAGAGLCALTFAALAASLALQRPPQPGHTETASSSEPAATWTSEAPAKRRSPASASTAKAAKVLPASAAPAPAGVWAAPASWERRVRAAAGQNLGGASIAAVSGGPIAAAGTWTEDAAWSTIKLPLLAAYINETGPLAGADRDLARKLIVDSDNDAANTFFLRLGDPSAGRASVEHVLRRAGDERTAVVARQPDGTRTYTWLGQTRWTLEDGVRTYRALTEGILAGPGATKDLLGLLKDAASSAMPWGLRAAVGRGTPLGEKVGVGTNTDGTVTVEQFGIVGSGRGACVLGVMARGPSEDAAKAVATRIAEAAVTTARAGGCTA